MDIPTPAWIENVPEAGRTAAMTKFYNRMRRVWNYAEPKYDHTKQEFILPGVLRNPRDRHMRCQRTRLLLQMAANYHNEFGHLTVLSVDCGKSLRTLSTYSVVMEYIPAPVCLALERVVGRHILPREQANPKAFLAGLKPLSVVRAENTEARLAAETVTEAF